jgi:hypothetical protein
MKRHIKYILPLTATACFMFFLAHPATAVVVGPGAFSISASVESFEGIGYINPFGALPLDFGSGVKLTGGARGDSSGTQIVDFSPPSGFFGFNTAAHIPAGTAFLGHANPGSDSTTALTFDEPMTRVGAYLTSSNLVTGETFVLTAYDSFGSFLESATIDPVPTAQWRTNFLGIQNPAGISKITIVSINGGGALMLDDLTFEVVPEPSSLVLIGIVLIASQIRLRRRRR